VIWIIAVVIPALNRGHLKKIPYDFCWPADLSLPLITIGAANAFGWMLAYLRGAAVIADWITSIAGNDPHLMMLLLVLAVHRGSAISSSRCRPSSSSCAGEHADPGRRHQRRPHGRGADRDTGVRADHAALRLVLLMASKFVGVSFGKALRAALPIYVVFLGDHHLHDLFPEGGAMAAEAGDSGIGGMFQVAGGDGYICPN